MKKVIKLVINYMLIGFAIIIIPAVLLYLLLAFIFLDLSWVVEHYIIRGIYGFAVTIWSIVVFACGWSAYSDRH